MVYSPLRSPPRRIKSPTRLLNMLDKMVYSPLRSARKSPRKFAGASNNGTAIVPFCETLSPSEEELFIPVDNHKSTFRDMMQSEPSPQDDHSDRFSKFSIDNNRDTINMAYEVTEERVPLNYDQQKFSSNSPSNTTYYQRCTSSCFEDDKENHENSTETFSFQSVTRASSNVIKDEEYRSCSDNENNVAYECCYDEDDDMIPRFQSISPLKRRKTINARANYNKDVVPLFNQMNRIDDPKKRRVSFGKESDNKVFCIQPYYIHENIKRRDLWWTVDELSQIRRDLKSLVASTRSTSMKPEVNITEIQNEICQYQISFRQSYHKAMLHQELISKEKDDLVIGLFHGHRGLEMFSPYIAYSRHKMMQDNISSIVSFYRNAKKQQHHVTERESRGYSDACIFPNEDSDGISNDEIIAHLLQRHSEMLTAGCRMWAKMLGEAEHYAAMDSIPINQSKNGNYDNDQVTDSSNTVNVLQSEQIMI